MDKKKYKNFFMQDFTQANEVYLGHMVQGKTEKVNYKVKKHTAKPEEEWIKVENTHEAVVSADDFAVVQRLLKADGVKARN